jgi:hypothetical protein
VFDSGVPDQEVIEKGIARGLKVMEDRCERGVLINACGGS